MKTIRLYHSRRNYTSRQKDRRACEASLKHSLRITHKETESGLLELITENDSLQWSTELLPANQIWVDSKITYLTKWEHEEKWNLLYQVAPQPKLHKHKTLQSHRTTYKHKIKKTINSLKKSGDIKAAEFLEQILNSKEYCSYNKISLFENFPMTRKSQRINMLETYLNAHNQLVRFPNANYLYVQEGIFKVPAQWNVSNKLITRVKISL